MLYIKTSLRQNVSRRYVRTAEIPYDIMSHGEKSYGEKSGHGDKYRASVSTSPDNEASQVRAPTDYILLFCVSLKKLKWKTFYDESLHVAHIHVCSYMTSLWFIMIKSATQILAHRSIFVF